MLWHGTGGMDAFMESERFAGICQEVARISGATTLSWEA